MALTQKIKLAIFESEPYETTNQRTGIVYKGWSNKGFSQKDDKVIRFTSPAKLPTQDIGAYDDAVAQEFTLFGTEYKGETRWSTMKREKQAAPDQGQAPQPPQF